MADVHNKEQRSRNMAAIRGRDTKPEMVVRRLVHRLGYRFRLHRRDLPGRPDLVLPRHRAVIFVHGCFWHQHDCRYGRVVPATRAEFWRKKRDENVARDARNLATLRTSAWRVFVVWECWTRELSDLEGRLKSFLKSSSRLRRR
ncbi:MAG TPA: DNA mismatch endonuclease Vsr [Thermoanaerobaculia bacterium]|nr:DNA mismatch endonuclease Vsr [Thermoanaerobaculia bacterium]